jgi:hypothetical protein
MGNSISLPNIKIGFEDMQWIIQNHANNCIIINTLDNSEQNCLITGTIIASNEVDIIDSLIQKKLFNAKIVIYGRNCNDEKIYKKYQQFLSLGFKNVFIYTGGLFEWLMLQDIFGNTEFPTTSRQLDFIRYKPKKILGLPLLEY